MASRISINLPYKLIDTTVGGFNEEFKNIYEDILPSGCYFVIKDDLSDAGNIDIRLAVWRRTINN